MRSGSIPLTLQELNSRIHNNYYCQCNKKCFLMLLAQACHASTAFFLSRLTNSGSTVMSSNRAAVIIKKTAILF